MAMLPAGRIQGGRGEREQEARLWLCRQKTSVLLLSALDLGENERVKMPLLSKRFTNSPVTLSQGETVSTGKIR